MTTLTLERYCYSETEIEGWLWIDDYTRLHTLERPWRPGAPGGLPNVSAVRDGCYEILPFRRSDGSDVFALRNHSLSVYVEASERPPEGGRFKILIHAGNYVPEDSQGCILPGLSRTIASNRVMVTNSREAMDLIRAARPKRLDIVCVGGTD